MYTNTDYSIHGASPCFLSPLADSLLLPLLDPLTYLETLLAVTGSVHLGLRLLVNWPPLCQPFPNPPPPQIPRTQIIKRLTMTTSRIRLLLSGTVTLQPYDISSAIHLGFWLFVQVVSRWNNCHPDFFVHPQQPWITWHTYVLYNSTETNGQKFRFLFLSDYFIRKM